jgi:hypothetical protein
MACRPRLETVFGPLLACSIITVATAQRCNHNSYIGDQPPELVSQTEHWLGWVEKVMLKGAFLNRVSYAARFG